MEDPLSCLRRDPPTKSAYKEYVATKITAFHESELRQSASKNSSMKYLNVALTGLRNRAHPAISYVSTVKEVRNMRPHLKFLTGDYLTYDKRSRQSGGSPHCRLCQKKGENETTSHLISRCEALNSPRRRILSEILALCETHKINIQSQFKNSETLTQFILDPCSLNLSERVNINHPVLPLLFKLSRDLCNAIHTERMRCLEAKTHRL